jgi:hypothetical protein
MFDLQKIKTGHLRRDRTPPLDYGSSGAHSGHTRSAQPRICYLLFTACAGIAKVSITPPNM